MVKYSTKILIFEVLVSQKLNTQQFNKEKKTTKVWNKQRDILRRFKRFFFSKKCGKAKRETEIVQRNFTTVLIV